MRAKSTETQIMKSRVVNCGVSLGCGQSPNHSYLDSSVKPLERRDLRTR